jgi:HlyD family secretion protein
MKKALLFLVLLAVGGGVVAVGSGAIRLGKKTVAFKTEKVRRGDVHATVSATGTIEPEEVVDVGAQVAGIIITMGRDPKNPGREVDWCTEVEEGTLLAQIDDTLYKARLEQANANLLQSIAKVEATRARLRQYEREWARAQLMHPTKAITDSDYDLARSNYENTKATLEVDKATVETNRALQAEAKANLGYSTIRSPVKGVIIDRRVNIGQTVVAALNAPSLFLIARDLKRMEIWASVNEADVGQLRKGQDVKFTVAAYPRDEFHGKVGQVRLNATMVSSVVTYTVVVAFDNSSAKLFPYMTANLQFEVAEHKNVLYLPNPALRWRPNPALVAKEERAKWGPILRRRAQGETDKTGLKVIRDHREFNTVWVKDDQGFVVPREIEVGLTDGINTEVLSGLQEGDEVVSGVERVQENTKSIIDFGNKMKQGGQ